MTREEESELLLLKRENKQLLSITELLVLTLDRTSQYTSNMFRSKLTKNNIDLSMTSAGKCYDNAVAERINGVLKTELGLNKIFAYFNEELIYVKTTIDIYNRLRIIGVKGYKTPIEIYREVKNCG